MAAVQRPPAPRTPSDTMPETGRHHGIDVDATVARLPDRIHRLGLDAAPQDPHHIVLKDDVSSWTRALLGEAVEVTADLLARLGVRPGDRVMLVNENCVECVALILALSSLNAWSVIVNARLAGPEIDAIRDHCRPRRLVYTSRVSENAVAHARRQGASSVALGRFGEVLASEELPSEPESVHRAAADQVAAMIYTSGTTGKPKGVMLTHLNLGYVAAVSGGQRALGSSDRVYGVLPISHVFGLTSMFLATLLAGGCLELQPVFDPAHLAQALAGGITVFQGVPTMYAKLLEYADVNGIDLAAPALRYLSAGGSPLDIDLKRRVEERFGTALNNGYGLTECSPTVSQTLVGQYRSDDSVGRPLPGLEIRIADAQGNALPPGALGELWVRGKNVMKGYYRDPEQTAKVLTPEGWLATGDLVRQEADGSLFLAGRVKELIIRSGFNVYPPEVEAALNSHPEVVLSAVVGRKVPGNEEVIAFVERIPTAKADEAELKAYLRRLLAPYKLPSRIIAVPSLPASAAGKVYKHRLATIAEGLPET